jgi:hypothetical protein
MQACFKIKRRKHSPNAKHALLEQAAYKTRKNITLASIIQHRALLGRIMTAAETHVLLVK